MPLRHISSESELARNKNPPNHLWKESMLNPWFSHYLDVHIKIWACYSCCVSHGDACVLQKPSWCCCLLGGLAAEELGEFAAWGPGRRHPDTEETPAEHTHLDPRSAQEHEMETVGSASMKTAFKFRPPQMCLFVRVWVLFLCASFLVLIIKKRTGHQKTQIRPQVERVWGHRRVQSEDQVTLQEQKSVRNEQLLKSSDFCHVFSEREFGAVSNCSPGLSTILYILPLNSLSIIHVQVDISALHGICCPTTAKPITLLGPCARARMSENERDVCNCSPAFVWVPCQRKCFLLPQGPKAQSCNPPLPPPPNNQTYFTTQPRSSFPPSQPNLLPCCYRRGKKAHGNFNVSAGRSD